MLTNPAHYAVKSALATIACLVALQAHGQDRGAAVLSGTVVSATDSTALTGVNVVLLRRENSTPQFGGATDEVGIFRIQVSTPGAYRLKLSFIGYTTVERIIRITGRDRDLDIIVMEEAPVESDEILVLGDQERVVMRGDTTVFNADAYKVNPDADAEALVRKMPGITVENGEVQAQGEAVRRVLLDGREFFGQDPTLALRNMPAEVVKEIEVYDRLSDQAQFTGFNDGNTEKTINIVTRPGMQVGQFGKLHGGFGTESRYIGGGSVNVFDDERRVSFIGLGNNVNQQNFSSEDLLGVLGTASGRRGGGGRRIGRGGNGQRGGRDADKIGGRGGGFGRMNSNPANFLIGQQPGISTTNALGLNYSDQWGDRIKVSSSYFFNGSDNASDVLLDREYVLADAQSQRYNESNIAESGNQNHRFNMRITYTIDEKNSIIFTPRVSLQNNSSSSVLDGVNSMPDSRLLSRTSNDYTSSNAGYTSSANILYRHRFAKQGRTISANVGIGLNDRTGDTDQLSSSDFFTGRGLVPDSTLAYDQRIESEQDGSSLSMVLSYTEPLGSVGQLEFSYRPSLSRSTSDRRANALDPVAQTYSVLDTAFSSVFDNDVIRQSGGVSIRSRGARLFGTAGFQIQEEHLQGTSIFPHALEIDRSFLSLLPYAMANYRFSRTNSLRLFYRTNTNTPSINQLQEVVDNTNPLQLSSGNPHLKPSYSHSLVARYNYAQGTRTFMGMVSVAKTNDYIGNASFFAQADTVLRPNVVLLQGAQFTQPENLGNQWTARSFITLGIPIWKTSFNVNGGFNYAQTPGIIDGLNSIATVWGLSGGAVLSSNISPEVDFTLSYRGTHSLVNNSLYPELDNNYMLHNVGARVYWMPLPRVIFDTNLKLLQYTGLRDSFDQSSTLLNVGVGYKLLKDRSLEAKLLVSDILNQNNNVSRTVTDIYIEDNHTDTLGRYVILSVSYRLRNFRM